MVENMLVNFIRESFTDMELIHMLVENMWDNIKIIKDTGQGTYTYANGDKYIGEWKKHKYNGQGTYIYANGDKYAGEWKKDKYNSPDNLRERDGQGTYIYANGDKYVGEWKKRFTARRRNLYTC